VIEMLVTLTDTPPLIAEGDPFAKTRRTDWLIAKFRVAGVICT